MSSEIKDPGFILINVNEKKSANDVVTLDIEPIKLPTQTNIFKCNFATTYFMEIYRGARDSNVKVFESHYFVDQQVIRLENLRFRE